ncbi:hypothetical protein DdX_06345 [Ditylenchus destructor]|uniref:Uncharacterized protein n=1 Tax=Ditylenchus destructor TaxID=166010 RepID=A0AAD4R913_9BILA|nr:hypothetical protein DdX_06345 [Ditylenchus destructor]
MLQSANGAVKVWLYSNPQVMASRGRGRGLMSLPSPPLSRKSSTSNIDNSVSRVAVVPPVQSSHMSVNVQSGLAKPVEKKPTAAKRNFDATEQNPGWGDSEITDLLKRCQKKESVSNKVDIKAPAAVTPTENKQLVSEEQKSSEAIGQNLNGIDITDVHKQRTEKVELVGKDTSQAVTINTEANSLIPPPEEDESGWASFDIRALLNRRKNRSSTTKTSSSGYYSNTKSLGDTSSEAKDNSTVIAVVKCPFKGNTELQQHVDKMVELNNNVVSSAVKVNSKVEAGQTVSKEPILSKSKSEVIPNGTSDSKDAIETSYVQPSMSLASKGLKNGMEMTRSIEFTKDELHEFHGLFKSCSESFDKLSKFFLKVGSHC